MSGAISWEKRRYYRDRLRDARHAALADAEGFHHVCFAVEALGLHLSQEQLDLGRYWEGISKLATKAVASEQLAQDHPGFFTRFDALYETLRHARNDAMHSGAYARHATNAAIDLCIILEEALMNPKEAKRSTVGDYMVRSPVSVEEWQPLAHARQLMLKFSFSFLPVLHNGKWMLLSDLELACHLKRAGSFRKAVGKTVSDAVAGGLRLKEPREVSENHMVSELLHEAGHLENVKTNHPTLWLVTESQRRAGESDCCCEPSRLIGVLSPFDLL